MQQDPVFGHERYHPVTKGREQAHNRDPKPFVWKADPNADDGALYRADQSMLDKLSQFLDGTAKIKADDRRKAFRYFKEGIKPIKDEYKALTKLLADMEVLNDQLRS